MNTKIRTIFMTIAFALTLTALTSLSASAYSDVNQTDWFNDNVKAVSEANIINGYEDGTFRPYGEVTYAEALKITSAVHANLTNNWEALENTTVIEDDYKDHWAGKYVTYALNSGIALGKLPRRDFDKQILRTALSTFLANALPQSQVTEINDIANAPEQYVTEYVQKLYKNGIMIGDGTSFNLYQYVTRAELAALSDRLLNPSKRVLDTNTTPQQPTPPPQATPTPTETPQVASNTLTVAVSGDLKDYIDKNGNICQIYISASSDTQKFSLTSDKFDVTKNAFVFETKPFDTNEQYLLSVTLTESDPVYKGLQYYDKLIDFSIKYDMAIIDPTQPLTATLIGNVKDDARVFLNMQDEVHDRIMALKQKFPEGCTESPCNGCNPFADAISDTIFRYQPVYAHYNVRDVKIGDLIYYCWSTADGGYMPHWVVVTDVDSTGVTVAEGNYSGKAHWGRYITFTELEKNANKVHLSNWDSSTIVLTRYLDTDTTNMRPLEYLPACEISILDVYNHWWADKIYR